MLKKLFRILNKDVTGRTWEVVASHPYFGKIVLFAFKNSDKSYWEAAVDCDGQTIGVTINTPDRHEPSEKHAEFARKLVSNLDATFARAAPLLVPEFERWHQKPFSPDLANGVEVRLVLCSRRGR